MSKWEGKSKVNPTAFKFFIKFLKHAGIRFTYFFLYFIAAYYLLFSLQSNKGLNQYYKKILGYSTMRTWVSRYKTYLTFARVLVDKVAFIAGIDRSYEFETDGIEHLKSLVRDNEGGILISAHIGNWEVAGHLLKEINVRVNVVMLDEEHETIKAQLDNVMGDRGYKVIPIKEDQSHIYKISTAILNKELICMHGDRFMPGSKTITIKFMDHQARFPLGPFAMASRLGVPITFVFGLKGAGNKYYLSASPPIYRKTPVNEIIEAFKNEVETRVKAHPHQWFNLYKFWED